MLGFKGFGILAACVYNFFSTLQAMKEFVLRYAWPYIPFLAKRPEDKFHDVVTRVMLQVCCWHFIIAQTLKQQSRAFQDCIG